MFRSFDFSELLIQFVGPEPSRMSEWTAAIARQRLQQMHDSGSGEGRQRNSP
jgi:hypothetical protein